MKVYNAIEKQQIMLFSDLLKGSLTQKELMEIQSGNLDTDKKINESMIESSNISVGLKEKVLDLLEQGMRLSIELDNLSKRGIKIKFTSTSDVINFVYSELNINPKLYFIFGNEELLSNPNVKIVYKYSDFQKIGSRENVIFLVDRKMDSLLIYKDIIKAVEKKSILLISNLLRSKAEIKIDIEPNSVDKKITKGKVFISGSRSQDLIPENVQLSLKSIKEQNIEVLIGDSDKGVDNEIIDYFRDSYDNVEVFSIKKKPRVQIEDRWKHRVIDTDSSLNPLEKQMSKDRVMANEADWGLSIFNPITKNRFGSIQVSSGTLRNTIQMLLNKKAVKFFYVFENEVRCKDLKLIQDLEKILLEYRTEKLSNEEIEEIISSNGVELDADFVYEKYLKIYNKFKKLIINEQKILREIDKDGIDENKTEQISLFASGK